MDRKLNKPFIDMLNCTLEERNAIVFEGNTNDRIFCPETGLKHPVGLLQGICRFLQKEGFETYTLSISEGLSHVPPADVKGKTANSREKSLLTAPRGNPRADCLSYLAQFFPALKSTGNAKIALIVETEDFRLPNEQKGMENLDERMLLAVYTELALSDSFRQSGNLVILFAKQGQFNRALTKSGAFRLINVPPPDEKQQHAFLSFLKSHKNFKVVFPEDLSLEELVKLSKGARLIDIEGVVKKHAREGTCISRKDINEIKCKSINEMSQGQLEVIIPDEKKNLDSIIGCDHVKRYIRHIALLSKSNSKSMPAMILMLGPPGVGKTHTAEVIAKELGWLMISLKNMRDKFVGGSESRMEQSLELIKSYEKVVCWVDEVDQMLGQRSDGSADGGVDARLFGMLLAATGSSDIKGKVLFLFSTNRVDLIDSALCDRTGINLVFLQPSAQEKKLLIPHLAKQQDRKLGEDVDVESLSKHPKLKGVSVRNLIDIITHAGYYADMENGKSNSDISHSHLERSIVLFNKGDILDTEFITLLSLSFVRFLDQLPWIGPDGKMKEDYDFPAFLEDLVKEDGQIDILKLNSRLNEIRQLRARERMMR